MAEYIPFTPSDNNYQVGVPLPSSNGGAPLQVWFDVHWNDADSSWYFDLYAEDLSPIVMGVRVVLGAQIGTLTGHTFFNDHVLQVYDTADSGVDAGYDDLGSRVQVVHFAMDEFQGRKR